MSAPDANGWMPIETAPKNGRWILGWGKRQNVADTIRVWRWDADAGEMETDVFGLWVDAADMNDYDDQPTHWQPLPKPPVTP